MYVSIEKNLYKRQYMRFNVFLHKYDLVQIQILHIFKALVPDDKMNDVDNEMVALYDYEEEGGMEDSDVDDYDIPGHGSYDVDQVYEDNHDLLILAVG